MAQHDGHCVRLFWRDNHWSPWIYKGRNCSEYNWKPYSFVDHDTYAQWKMCKEGGACASVAENWGF